MAIPASQIVSVNPRVLTAGGNDLEINGLLLTRSATIPLSSMVMTFTSATAVGDYMGTDTPEYIAASKYFLGYNNCFAYPKHLMIARYLDEDAGAEIRGGEYEGKLGDLQAITDGTLTLSVNGTEYDFSSIDLSSVTSYSDVAATLQDAIGASVDGATVEYSSLYKGFVITVPYTEDTDNTAEAIVTGEENDLAVILCLTSDDGATVSDGSAALSLADNFKAIREKTDNWVCFTTAFPAEDEEALALADWAQSQGVQYLYIHWSVAKNLLTQGETDSIASQFKEANVGSTALVYGDLDYAAFIAGCAASIDWNRINGVITFKFRYQDGLAATITSETDADTLIGKTCNYYGQWATRNDNHIFLAEGSMFGDYGFIDPYINAVWLNNALQVSLLEGLKMSPRTPYTDAGYTLIRSWMADPIARAIRNGAIDAGVTLSETQKAEVYRETGRDISGELYANGYVILVEDPGASVRANRESPDISLYYCYGGSVHKLVVASTALL